MNQLQHFIDIITPLCLFFLPTDVFVSSIKQQNKKFINIYIYKSFVVLEAYFPGEEWQTPLPDIQIRYDDTPRLA